MKDKTIWLDGVPSLEISSTFIRNQVKNKKSTEYILPEFVKEYIINSEPPTHAEGDGLGFYASCTA